MKFPEGFLDIFYASDLLSLHNNARNDGIHKVIEATPEPGFLCFGQYREDYPVKALQAVFEIAINDNSKNDQNCLILDVYDHHSDRVLAKKIVTRKDFWRIGICLFTLDFVPPSQQARLEFRVYYMGGPTIVVSKIAIVDPFKIVAMQHGQLPIAVIPHPVEDNPLIGKPSPPTQPPAEPDSLSPWSQVVIGNGSGQIISHHIQSSQEEGNIELNASFQIEGSGKIDDTDDKFFFVYYKLPSSSENGKLVATIPKQEGVAGLMLRETLDPDSKFILLDRHRVLWREETGEEVKERRLDDSNNTVKGLKLVRKRSGDEQYYIAQYSNTLSADSNDIIAQTTVSLNMKQRVFAGIACANAKGAFRIGVKFKNKV